MRRRNYFRSRSKSVLIVISLLIPTYNYNVYPLVLELHEQCEKCGINFEIIVLDDCSNIHFPEHNQINDFAKSRYLVNNKNLGRSSTINKLAALSKFDYMLILEADAFLSQKNYIQLYLNSMQQKPQAVFGGVNYAEVKPAKTAMLRWIYGKARESKSLDYRIANPFDIVFSWNLLIEKKLFLELSFDSSITTYGFEDLVFLKQLKSANVKIIQIENTLVHQNEEQSAVFIEKSKAAVGNLVDLYQKKILSGKDSNLLKAFEIVEKIHFTSLLNLSFINFENLLVKNLLSEKPSLFLFDLYRLGYFCTLTRYKKT
jgi:glycosyltransferase involved in cell wall biosynthesis